MRILTQIGLGACLFIAILFATTPSCVSDPIIPDIPDDTMDIDTMIPVDSSLTCDPDTIYFRKDVLPIIRSSCGMGFCHDETAASGDYVIRDYEDLVTSGMVEPFDAEGSLMYQVLTNEPTSGLMPPAPRGPISDASIIVIRRWIEQGALNLDCPDDSECFVDGPVSFATDVFPIIDKHCIGCHSGNNPWAGLFLRDHQEIADAAIKWHPC